MEVKPKDVIQRAKCAARINPMPTIISKVERCKFLSSSLVFLCKRTKGNTSKVVNNNLYNAIDSEGTFSCIDTINIDAKETAAIEIKSATYGLFFIIISQ